MSAALVVADLPIHSYDSPDLAVRSSRRLIDGGAHAVKLEGGQACSAQIRAITSAGIPFVGHIGMLPQHVLEEGGYRTKGRTAEERSFLFNEARAIEDNGGFALVLELIDSSVAAKITQSVTIPTIGIGSGMECDGQILVFHDLVGYFPWFKPKHAESEGNVAEEIRKAARASCAKQSGAPSGSTPTASSAAPVPTKSSIYWRTSICRAATKRFPPRMVFWFIRLRPRLTARST